MQSATIEYFESEKCVRDRNKESTDALLAALILHHGVPSVDLPSDAPAPAEPVQASEAVIDLVPAVVMAPPKTSWGAMQAWLDRYEPLPKGNYPAVGDIKKVVAKHYGITVIDIDSHRRTADVTGPRQVAMYLTKKLTPRSLPDIGRKFGGRDHTTVHHAVHKIERLIASDPEMAAEIETLEEKL